MGTTLGVTADLFDMTITRCRPLLNFLVVTRVFLRIFARSSTYLVDFSRSFSLKLCFFASFLFAYTDRRQPQHQASRRCARGFPHLTGSSRIDFATHRPLVHQTKDLPVCLKGAPPPNHQSSPSLFTSTLVQHPVEGVQDRHGDGMVGPLGLSTYRRRNLYTIGS
jgi:hypothetical protein